MRGWESTFYKKLQPNVVDRRWHLSTSQFVETPGGRVLRDTRVTDCLTGQKMEASTGKVEIHTRDGKYYISSKRFFDILRSGGAMKHIPGAGEAVTVRGYEAVFGRRDGVVACVEFEIMFMAGSNKLKALFMGSFQISPLQVIMQAVNMPKEGPVPQRAEYVAEPMPRRDYGPNKGRYPKLKLVGSPRHA